MPGIQEALELQKLLELVGDHIKDHPHGRSYRSPDGDAYVLALGGEEARAMSDFMKAVGHYLMKVRHMRGDKEAAKADLLRELDEWLAKMRL